MVYADHRMMRLAVLMAAAAGRVCSVGLDLDMEPLECQPAASHPQWPTFHLFNRVVKSKRGGLALAPANDANAVFQYRGMFHVMNQGATTQGIAGVYSGVSWTHAVSDDLVRWYRLRDVLGPAVGSSSASSAGRVNDSWGHNGACDGTVSFPDGQPGPIITWGPDCGDPLPHPPSSRRRLIGSSDYPRVAVARPVDPSSPLLEDWYAGHPVEFDNGSLPCAFAGPVWRSADRQWSMVCISPVDTRLAGTYARYVSDDPQLQHWRLADPHFAKHLNVTGRALGNLGSSLFHRIPNPAPGGPTHILAGNVGETPTSFFLGTFDTALQQMNVTAGPQTIEACNQPPWVHVDDPTQPGQSQWTWAAVGGAHDGRLLIVAWLRQYLHVPGVNVFHAGNPLSLIREILWEASTSQLISRPVVEYDSLRNATVMQGQHLGVLGGSASGASRLRLPLPGGLGGALDVLLSFELLERPAELSSFGVAVRAPPNTTVGAAFVATFTVTTSPQHADKECVSSHVQMTINGNVSAEWPLLCGESLDVRILVDRPVVEIYGNGGRGSFVYADANFEFAKQSVHVFNNGGTAVGIRNASVYGMACGWRPDTPTSLHVLR